MCSIGMSDSPGPPRRLRQHGVHGHRSPWKKFEWHIKPQHLAALADMHHSGEHAVKHVVHNVNNVTASMHSSYVFQESGVASSGPGLGLGGGDSTHGSLESHGGLGALGALAGIIDIKLAALVDPEFEVPALEGAPRATLAEAAAADREIVFPVCEAEPSACTDACMYRVELVLKRCMAWLHVSDTRTGSGAQERSADTKAAACQSALTSARGGCDAAEHAGCLHPIAHNFEALLATHHPPVVA